MTASPTGSVRDVVRESIRELVIDGELRPGDRLVERQLAARLGVSRVPVREALRQLTHEGFVEERPTRGMVVRRLDEADVETLFDVRASLEDLLCQRVVASASEADLDRVEALVTRAYDALTRGDLRETVALNAAFHAALVEVAGSGVLAAVMEPVSGRMKWLLSQHDEPQAMTADHAAILRALRDRDVVSARRLCRDHLATSRAAAGAAASRGGVAGR